MKKNIVILIIAVLLVFSSCTGKEEENGKLNVIVTLFPQYDMINQISEGLVDVSLILPPGVEPHSYEPTPQDIIRIQNSDLFVYTGEFMEPWATKVVEKARVSGAQILEVSAGIDLHEGFDHEDEHGHENFDPHIWVDPINAKQMVDNIVEALISIDETNKDLYINNGEKYKKELDRLDSEFLETFSKTKSKTIVFGGHFSLGYFVERYDLDFVTPYNSFAPDAEPTPKSIIELINTINETSTKAIFYEGLVDPKVARVISEETGAMMLLINVGNNITKDQMEDGITFIDLMEENLKNLRIGLGYEE